MRELSVSLEGSMGLALLRTNSIYSSSDAMNFPVKFFKSCTLQGVGMLYPFGSMIY